MRITNQLRGTTIDLLIFAVNKLASVYINRVANDSKVVNYAGIGREAIQRVAKLELIRQFN